MRPLFQLELSVLREKSHDFQCYMSSRLSSGVLRWIRSSRNDNARLDGCLIERQIHGEARTWIMNGFGHDLVNLELITGG